MVIVATIRALKFHGGSELVHIDRENLDALDRGIANLERHIVNVRTQFGLPCVVAVNNFASDTIAEHALLARKMAALTVPLVLARHWAEGSAGAIDLARTVVQLAQSDVSRFRFVYDDAHTIWEKILLIATKIYGAADIAATAKVRARITQLQEHGYGHYPVCIAKTQYSFSSNPSARGAPSGHTLDIREVRLAAGAEFIVAICGDVMTMPGLPKVPAAERIDITADGRVRGLF